MDTAASAPADVFLGRGSCCRTRVRRSVLGAVGALRRSLEVSDQAQLSDRRASVNTRKHSRAMLRVDIWLRSMQATRGLAYELPGTIERSSYEPWAKLTKPGLMWGSSKELSLAVE